MQMSGGKQQPALKCHPISHHLGRFSRQFSRVFPEPSAWSTSPAPFRSINAAKVQEFFGDQNPRKAILQKYINFITLQLRLP